MEGITKEGNTRKYKKVLGRGVLGSTIERSTGEGSTREYHRWQYAKRAILGRGY